MPSLSVCCIFVDAAFAECDVSMDEKSTLPCTHPDSVHQLIVPNLGERESKREQGSARERERESVGVRGRERERKKK